MLRRLLAALFTLMGLVAAAHGQTIVDADAVKAAVARGALIWDTRDETSFAKGHIPGAVNIGNSNDELRDANNEDYLPVSTAAATAGATIDTRAVLSALETPGTQIIDVRTPREFSGEDIRALRGGHIPGARNIPYEANWIDPEAMLKMRRGELKDTAGMSLKPAAELRRLYAGLDPARETIVYCNSGVRAAETAAVLRELGFADVKVYDPSWIGWAATARAPVESETFLNIGTLTQRINALHTRIESLERPLAEARKPAAP